MSAADGIKRLEQRAELFAKTRLGLAALCVVVAFGAGWFGHRPAQPSIPVAEQRSIDSLFTTYPIYIAARQATIVTERAAVDTADRAAKRGVTTLAVARRDSAIADNLERAAFVAHDTAAVTWEGIASARMVEAEHAMQAAESLRVALTAMTVARIAADDRAALDSARVASLTDALTRTANDLRAADPPCRILWLHCPSRRSVAVVGVALGVAATIAIPRALK